MVAYETPELRLPADSALHKRVANQKVGTMRYGYARVSTTDQDLAGQVTALHEAGCGWIFEDRTSGVRSARDRAGPGKLLGKLQAGDVLVHQPARGRQ
jgi:hypothetical protein